MSMSGQTRRGCCMYVVESSRARPASGEDEDVVLDAVPRPAGQKPWSKSWHLSCAHVRSARRNNSRPSSPGRRRSASHGPSRSHRSHRTSRPTVRAPRGLATRCRLPACPSACLPVCPSPFACLLWEPVARWVPLLPGVTVPRCGTRSLRAVESADVESHVMIHRIASHRKRRVSVGEMGSMEGSVLVRQKLGLVARRGHDQLSPPARRECYCTVKQMLWTVAWHGRQILDARFIASASCSTPSRRLHACSHRHPH